MTLEELAKQAAVSVKASLEGRPGFDGWWYEIDPVTQEEILSDMARVIANVMKEMGK